MENYPPITIIIEKHGKTMETELLEQILSELRASNDNRLWSLNDIAAYIGLSKSQIQKTIVCKIDFPKPIRLTEKRGRRWLPKEVKDWVLNRKENATNTAGRPRNAA